MDNRSYTKNSFQFVGRRPAYSLIVWIVMTYDDIRVHSRLLLHNATLLMLNAKHSVVLQPIQLTFARIFAISLGVNTNEY